MSLDHTPEPAHSALTGHAIRIRKLFFAPKDILHLLLLHLGFFEVRLLQEVLVGACAAFEAVRTQWMLGSGIGTGDCQGITAVGTNCIYAGMLVCQCFSCF